MLSERGRVSGSFLVAVLAVVVGIGGYVGWSILRPNEYVLSERMVRDARRALAGEVRELQREVDAATGEAKRQGKDVAPQLDKIKADAMKGIDEVVDDTRDQLGDLDIELRTLRNRMDRITSRAQEARDMVEEYVEDAKRRAKAGT